MDTRHPQFSRSWSILLLGFALALGSAEDVRAQCVESELAKIQAFDGLPADYFGHAVAVDEDAACVGAPSGFGLGGNGAVYVYRFDSLTRVWDFDQELIASDGADNDLFGYSVAISGEVILVGSPWDDDACDSNCHSGSAYVFRYHGETVGWIEEQKLTNSDAAAGDYFGLALAVEGDVALIGAPRDDDAGNKSGSAYVYRYDPSAGVWVEEQKLRASDESAEDRFGLGIELDDGVALIGSRFDDDNGGESGSAYVFRYDSMISSWIEEQKLIAMDGSPDDLFGWTVSIEGDNALIGAYQDDDAGSCSGSAYVFGFDGSTWTERQKIVASDASAEDFFGWAVSLGDDHAIIGAPQRDLMGDSSGGAYLFRYQASSDTWIESHDLVASEGTLGDLLGYSVSSSGPHAFLGAPLDDPRGRESGSAYAYSTYDLQLSVSADAVNAGDRLGFETCSGQPGALALLAVVGIDGTPIFNSVVLGRFGSDFTWSFDAIVPPGLGGIEVSFQSFGITIPGWAGESNRVTVEFR